MERRIISDQLYIKDQNLVANLLHQHELDSEYQAGDLMMKDLDQTRIQRSLAILYFYQRNPTMQSSLDHIDIVYDLRTNFYEITDIANGDLLSVGTLN